MHVVNARNGTQSNIENINNLCQSRGPNLSRWMYNICYECYDNDDFDDDDNAFRFISFRFFSIFFLFRSC